MACKLSENHWEFFLFFWLDNTNQKLERVFKQSFTKKRYLLPRLQAIAWYDYPFSSQEATILLASAKSQNLWSGPIDSSRSTHFLSFCIDSEFIPLKSDWLTVKHEHKAKKSDRSEVVILGAGLKDRYILEREWWLKDY